MKNIFILLVVLVTLFLSGCGFNISSVENVSNTITNVELSKNNFKILEKVTGESSNYYLFGIGGLSNNSLIAQAKNKMMDNARLKGGSKTVINITYDTHIAIVYPFFYKKTITAAGYVVEFTD